MGLTSWKESPDGMIYRYDVGIAKNYLKEEELEKLKDLTNLFLDVAETEAKDNDKKKDILKDSGKISHELAMDKANNEYEKYRIKQDLEYISSMGEMYDRYLKEHK